MSDIKMPFTHMAESPRGGVVRVVKPAPVCRADFRDARIAADVAPPTTVAPRRAEHFQIPTMIKPDVAMPHLRQQKRQTAVVSATPPPVPVRRAVVHTRTGVGTVAGADYEIVDR